MALIGAICSAIFYAQTRRLRVHHSVSGFCVAVVGIMIFSLLWIVGFDGKDPGDEDLSFLGFFSSE